MSIPIVLIHKTLSSYLIYSLAQAKKTNPNSKIYLLGDSSNNRFDFVEHRNISNYMASAENFSLVYQHFSPNDYDYELFCLQRWFVLKEFLLSEELNHCLYIDSDVLLYEDVTEEQMKFQKFDMTLSSGLVPHCNFINNVTAIIEFCEFALHCYTNPSCLEIFKHQFELYLANESTDGASDMKVFEEFRKLNPKRIGEISIIQDNSIYDMNINVSSGFEMNNEIKKVYWINEQPFCREIESSSYIKMNALHFQGGAKKYMKEFFLKANRGFFVKFFLLRYYSIIWIEYKYYRLLKLIT
ncbi:MAG: hypothetical protein ACKPDM_00640 [Dolichospermum sp.]